MAPKAGEHEGHMGATAGEQTRRGSSTAHGWWVVSKSGADDDGEEQAAGQALKASYIYAHVCVCAHVCVHVHMCMCMYR